MSDSKANAPHSPRPSQIDESIEESIATWLSRLKTEGCDDSHQAIWNAYFEKIVSLARRKLVGQRVREYDEEDVAVSAFNSFFRAVKEERLPQLDDEVDLWKVLVVITLRKISTQRRRAMADKRGGGRVRGESIFESRDGDRVMGLEGSAGEELSPELAAEIVETYQRVMDNLGDDTLRKIAQLKLEGYSQQEIAEKLGCVERTVRRKLERIRMISEKVDENGD